MGIHRTPCWQHTPVTLAMSGLRGEKALALAHHAFRNALYVCTMFSFLFSVPSAHLTPSLTDIISVVAFLFAIIIALLLLVEPRQCRYLSPLRVTLALAWSAWILSIARLGYWMHTIHSPYSRANLPQQVPLSYIMIALSFFALTSLILHTRRSHPRYEALYIFLILLAAFILIGRSSQNVLIMLVPAESLCAGT